MSRHRKPARPQGHGRTTPNAPAVTPVPPPSLHTNTPAGTSAPARPVPGATVSANGASAPPDDTTAELLALRAQIEETRRELNARLDTLAQAVERLLPAHPAAPPGSTGTPAHSAAPSESTDAPAHHIPRSETSSARAPGPPVKAVRVGEEVYVPSLGGTFTVVEVSSSGRTFKVQAGPMRVQVRSDEIWTLDDDTPAQARKSPGHDTTQPWPHLSTEIPELDLHGFTESDALVTLELFLHHAFTQRTPRVRVIHGKGDGILRAAVRRELVRSKLVRAIDTGPHFRGDDGVTLAELDL